MCDGWSNSTNRRKSIRTLNMDWLLAHVTLSIDHETSSLYDAKTSNNNLKYKNKCKTYLFVFHRLRVILRVSHIFDTRPMKKAKFLILQTITAAYSRLPIFYHVSTRVKDIKCVIIQFINEK